MKAYRTKILNSQKQGNSYHLLVISQPELADLAKPGQFVYLKVSESYDPLLPRPLSIHQIDHKKGIIYLLFQIKGKGTKVLSALKTGDELTVLGPLGNGFRLNNDYKNIVLVGGGIGTAPLLYLATELLLKNCGLTVLLGYKDRNNLVAYESFAQLDCRLLIATEDGSWGQKGRITELLNNLLEEERIDSIYACGPEPMLKAVQEIAAIRRVEDCQLSLEARMGCGIGACMSCVCGVKMKDGSYGYKKVCNEGPVFDSKEVSFNE